MPVSNPFELPPSVGAAVIDVPLATELLEWLSLLSCEYVACSAVRFDRCYWYCTAHE